MIEKLHNFYFDKEEPEQRCLLALREIILSCDDKVTETVKYGMPCFCYGKKAFCYLWIDKKTNEPYLLMVEGKLLHHPKLETGDRARMKIFRVNPKKNIPLEETQSILHEALDLYRSGTISIK